MTAIGLPTVTANRWNLHLTPADPQAALLDALIALAQDADPAQWAAIHEAVQGWDLGDEELPRLHAALHDVMDDIYPRTADWPDLSIAVPTHQANELRDLIAAHMDQAVTTLTRRAS